MGLSYDSTVNSLPFPVHALSQGELCHPATSVSPRCRRFPDGTSHCPLGHLPTGTAHTEHSRLKGPRMPSNFNSFPRHQWSAMMWSCLPARSLFRPHPRSPSFCNYKPVPLPQTDPPPPRRLAIAQLSTLLPAPQMHRHPESQHPSGCSANAISSNTQEEKSL